MHGHGDHLSHVNNFYFSRYLKAYRQNLVKMVQYFLRKASFNFICKWPWAKVKKCQEMTLTLNTHMP